MSISTFKKSLLVSGIVLTLATVGGTKVFEFSKGHAEVEKQQAPAQAMPVSVALVQPKNVTQWNEFSGRLEAIDSVEVRSRVAGAVQSIHFKEGAIVKQGDLLVKIDPAPFEAEVARARAEVSAAQSKLAFAKNELERGKRLIDSRTVSQSDYDQRMNVQTGAQADLQAAEAVLKTAMLNLDYTDIRAPITGRVGRIEITPGNLIAAGPSSPLLTSLVSISPIYASFEADENVVAKALADLPSGLNGRDFVDRIPVQMDVQGSNGVAGKLQLINNSVDVSSGTVKVRAVFDNADGRLMPGQFAKVRMGQANERQELLVDEKAVGTDQNKKFVMVVNPQNIVEYREITLGARAEGLRIVTAGLQADEKIVVNGLQRIRPGSLVAPQMVAMGATAAANQQALAEPAKQ
ncbi:membrane fusion protein, multidrug efflux system [Phyllobacterium sp. YR620]|uniref:Efflux RND transporter periplasmic adaptor subunit n=1 Tax=Phyllobacterium pellucidum TaxID=2740464 RepID=A0A849VIU9_9HYPH|nr:MULTISPECIES: efflux RND transporter periplasmic adaptor subunit [Phyllobacterium]NTS30125.1 efflux RND transporter periplasmic adaptor subunit [Phyllobacterium pellucidum]UGY11136.1 efflux RND transporter periplasmic adaptor subunit [Phyllobacterium sp. T1018]SDP73460.1 membrane fusion protein, multidrug efflux system [Phyllobacterium sp. YR620]SFI51269.1 membrane fusion protein, multidrug efflux system [Phyllobacterium sp. CL33Tsu]